MQRLETQAASRREVVDILKSGAIGSTEGYTGFMRAFARQIVNGLWLTGFSIQGSGEGISLNGRTLRPELVPAYLRRLNQEPVMQGREIGSLQIGAPKAGPAKDAAAGPAQPAPRYLEFSLQSGEPAREAKAQ